MTTEKERRRARQIPAGLSGMASRVVDAAIIALAHLAACRAYGIPWRPLLTDATAIAVLTFGAIGEALDLYRIWRLERTVTELREASKAWLGTAGILATAAFFATFGGEISRRAAGGWFLLAGLGLVGRRLLARVVLSWVRARGRDGRRVAILGGTPIAERLVQEIVERPGLGLRIVGVYDDRTGDRRAPLDEKSCPYRGGIAALLADARAGQIDEVYVALPNRAEERIGEVLRSVADTKISVTLVADFFTHPLLFAKRTSLGSLPLVTLTEEGRGATLGHFLKRTEDLVVGTMILMLIGIPMLIIAVAIKLSSRGPVLFRQRRYALNGQEIRVLKFRTMTVAEDGPTVLSTRSDRRVTPLGAFLRRTSLDELPQFLQVLTGAMSIVGPRPHAVAHNETYRHLIRGYMMSRKVKPGITGWAQVNGWRGETPDLANMQRRIEHDLQYIRNWSLLWDLKIVLLTIFGARRSRNAY